MGGTNRVTASTSPQGANIASSTAASSKTDRKRKEDDALSEESLRLQRKRLSDRRSQRTAREKTRQRIKELERALEKLSAANAGSKLQEQIAENMALRKENAQLKRRLGHISSLCRIGEIDAEELDYGSDKQGDRSDKSAEPCQSQAEDDYVGNSMTTATHLVTPHVAPEINLDRMDVEAEVPADVNEREVFAPANIWSTSDTMDDLTFWSTTVNTNGVPAWPWPILENVQFYESNIEEASGPEILETALSGNEMGNTVDWNIPFDALKDQQQTMSMQFFGEGFVSETQPQQPSSLGYSSSGVDSDTQVVVPRQGYHSHKGPRSFRTFNAASGLRANHLMLGITASPITFLNWIQTVVEKYSCFTEERLDALLPRVPCIHPYFGGCAQSCDKLLSLGLSKVLQSCMPLVDFTSLLGAYHILHRLLRVSQYNILVSGEKPDSILMSLKNLQYLIRPVQEELCVLPTFMQPTPVHQRSTGIFTWFNFMPWSHLREAMQINQRHKDIEIQLTIAHNIHLLWPSQNEEAITFNPLACEGITSPLEQSHSRCACPGPWVTKSFEAHISRLENWRLKRGADPANKFPELKTLVV